MGLQYLNLHQLFVKFTPHFIAPSIVFAHVLTMLQRSAPGPRVPVIFHTINLMEYMEQKNNLLQLLMEPLTKGSWLPLKHITQTYNLATRENVQTRLQPFPSVSLT